MGGGGGGWGVLGLFWGGFWGLGVFGVSGVLSSGFGFRVYFARFVDSGRVIACARQLHQGERGWGLRADSRPFAIQFMGVYKIGNPYIRPPNSRTPLIIRTPIRYP